MPAIGVATLCLSLITPSLSDDERLPASIFSPLHHHCLLLLTNARRAHWQRFGFLCCLINLLQSQRPQPFHLSLALGILCRVCLLSQVGSIAYIITPPQHGVLSDKLYYYLNRCCSVFNLCTFITSCLTCALVIIDWEGLSLFQELLRSRSCPNSTTNSGLCAAAVPSSLFSSCFSLAGLFRYFLNSLNKDEQRSVSIPYPPPVLSYVCMCPTKVSQLDLKRRGALCLPHPISLCAFSGCICTSTSPLLLLPPDTALHWWVAPPKPCLNPSLNPSKRPLTHHP